ncbi:MAG: MobF family relaxase, partial [Solirubrobacteraceae bacterium]
MLTVAKVTAGGGQGYAAYLEGKTQAREQGDYYLRDGERVEAPGRWALGPDGVAELGVDRSAPVASEPFRALMNVRHPVSGEQLRALGANGQAVVAIDATFSAPKSVSAVWALASPELRAAIESAHERGIDRALHHAREMVPMVRRRLDQKTVVRESAREILATSWRHTTARAVGGRPPDPQLHSHVLIHGALRSDGRVVAVESRAWMVHQREIGATYRSELAAELQRLGFEIERGTGRGGRYFEIAGVPDGLRERWSSRHREVTEAIEQRMAEKRSALEAQIAEGGSAALEAAERLDALERSGRLMPAEERRLARGSRSAKDTLVTAGDLDREWWQTSVEFGFDARSVEELRGVARRQEHPTDIALALLARLTEFDATFAEREARATALEVAPDLGPEQGLAALERLRERGELLDLADGRMTTRAHRALERQTVALAGELAGARAPTLDELFVQIETDALRLELAEHEATLAPEQQEAIALACADRQLVVIVGQAGTGKSTALLGVARAHEQDGRRVLVTSTGAQAAERLALELQAGGVEARGYSTAALRASVEHGRLELDGSVTILHDEAALASTREQRWLYGAARDSGARLVAIGDPRQSQAVGAGGLWGRLEELAREQGAYVELTQIVRAREPADRRDQALFRAGKHERAIEGYAERGRVLFETDQRRAEDRALEAAQTDRLAERSTLVIAETSNERLDMLNARAQAIRSQEGELGHERIALRGRPYGLSAGDEVVVRAPLSHPELGPVRNGTTAEVLQVDPANEHATLRLADGREARWERELLDAGQTRLAYVSHPFPVQGRTSETAHVIAGPHSSAEGSYVGLTRARDHTRLYAARDQLELTAEAPVRREVRALAERLGRSEPEVPSISVPLVGERHVEREHARQTLPSAGEQGTEALERLRAERDELRALLATYPSHAAERIRHHEQRDAEARDAVAVARARERAELLHQEIDQMSRWQRRGEAGRHARVRLQTQGQVIENIERGQEAARSEIARLRSGPDSPEHWEAKHPGARERLQAAERAFELAVDRRAARQVELPGEHLTRVL